MLDGWMGGVDEEMMMEGLSKTMVRGKQNNTSLGRVMKNGGIYIWRTKSRSSGSTLPGYVGGCLPWPLTETPSLPNMLSNVLKATGLTKLRFR